MLQKTERQVQERTVHQGLLQYRLVKSTQLQPTFRTLQHSDGLALNVYMYTHRYKDNEVNIMVLQDSI